MAGELTAACQMYAGIRESGSVIAVVSSLLIGSMLFGALLSDLLGRRLLIPLRSTSIPSRCCRKGRDASSSMR